VAHSRIYLIGFMGAGKSTVGRHLARKLGWKFVDLDEEIERRERRPIAEIFKEHGELISDSSNAFISKNFPPPEKP